MVSFKVSVDKIARFYVSSMCTGLCRTIGDQERNNTDTMAHVDDCKTLTKTRDH